MTRFTRTNPPEGFYTYAYLREDGRPYYVGKGGGSNPQRAWQRHGSAKKPWQPPCDERILFLKWGMTEDEAHAHEIYMIAVYGNYYAKGGWLNLNFTDGGEGTTGYQYTEELRQLRANQLKGNNYGAQAIWDDERRQRLSAATTGVKKTRTAALLDRHESLHVRFHWEHPVLGKRHASGQEMSKETGFSQAHFWRAANGKAGTSHGWVCLDPVASFQPKEKNTQLAVEKAAATRLQQGADELGVTVEEYRAMSTNQRYRAKKRLAAAA